MAFGKIAPKSVLGLYNRFLNFISGTGISVAVSGQDIQITNTGVTSVAAGTGVSVSATTGGVTVTNTGVTSVAGTTNQVNVSATTGGVTFSLPQSIGTASSVTFFNLILGAGGVGSSSAPQLFLNGSAGTSYPGAGINGQRNGTNSWRIGDYSSIFGGSSLDIDFYNVNASGGWRFTNSSSSDVFTISSSGSGTFLGNYLTLGNGSGNPFGLSGIVSAISTTSAGVNCSYSINYGSSTGSGAINFGIGATQTAYISAYGNNSSGGFVFNAVMGCAIYFQIANSTKAYIDTSGNFNSNALISTGVYTVATLPSSPTQGSRACVTDALANTYGSAPTGGHSTFAPVIYTGSGWIMG